MPLVLGSDLFPRQGVTCAAIHGIQTYNVCVLEFRNRAINYGGACRALAQVARDGRRQSFVGSAAHQFQSVVNFFIRQDAEERRLRQLHGQALLECVVKRDRRWNSKNRQ